MEHTLSTIFSGILIAIISSWVTVSLSLRKFQNERIWESKLNAYIKIIECLNTQREFVFYQENFVMGLYFDDRHEKEHNNFEEKSRNSEYELMKYQDIGELLISETAIKLLKEYHFKTKEAKDYFEINDRTYDEVYIKMVADAVKLCIEKIKLEANKDLKSIKN